MLPNWGCIPSVFRRRQVGSSLPTYSGQFHVVSVQSSARTVSPLCLRSSVCAHPLKPNGVESVDRTRNVCYSGKDGLWQRNPGNLASAQILRNAGNFKLHIRARLPQYSTVMLVQYACHQVITVSRSGFCACKEVPTAPYVSDWLYKENMIMNEPAFTKPPNPGSEPHRTDPSSGFGFRDPMRATLCNNPADLDGDIDRVEQHDTCTVSYCTVPCKFDNAEVLQPS